MDRKKIVLVLIIVLSVFVIVDFALADYQIQVAIPGGPAAGQAVSLAQYIRSIYIFGLSLVGIAALGSLVIAGFRYMLSDTVDSKDAAKSMIWSSLSGLILGLSAYLILYTINPDLLKNQPPTLPAIAGTISTQSSSGTAGTISTKCNNSFCNDSRFPNAFVKSGVILDGVGEPIVNEINTFNNELGAAVKVVITSGADTNLHTTGVCSHYNGCKLDIRKNDTVVNYIQTNFEPKGQRSDGTRLYEVARENGQTSCYAIESDHVDVAAAACR